MEDVKTTLDQLDVVEKSVAGLKGRIDRSRIAIVGHSFGAQTAAMLLGASIINPDGTLGEDLSDSRIAIGVLLAAGGRGGEDLTPFAAEHFPHLNQSYAGMSTPSLIVAGDHDHSPLTVRGPEWFIDPYTLSPAPKSLLTLFGGEHMLGGISGYLVTETTDENPDRVAAVQRFTTAYLRSAFYPEDSSWRDACSDLMESPVPLARVENK